MSYRAFKRLLGETSLERKCRFLFGAATLLLITASFWWYARQTEDLAYDQMTTIGRLMATQLFDKKHDSHIRPADQAQKALDVLAERHLSEALPDYQYRLIKPNSRSLETQAEDSYEQKLLQEFLD